MYKVEGDRLTVFIPKCPQCNRDMIQFGRRGVGGATGGRTQDSILGNVTVDPAIIWTKIVYHCKKHQHIGYNFALDDVIKMNQYPARNIDFLSAPEK